MLCVDDVVSIAGGYLSDYIISFIQDLLLSSCVSYYSRVYTRHINMSTLQERSL